MPACFNILLNVPKGISFLRVGMIIVLFDGFLNFPCVPFWVIKLKPNFFKTLIISSLEYSLGMNKVFS